MFRPPSGNGAPLAAPNVVAIDNKIEQAMVGKLILKYEWKQVCWRELTRATHLAQHLTNGNDLRMNGFAVALCFLRRYLNSPNESC